MPINNNTYMLLEKRKTERDYLRDLIDSGWEYLSPFQRKRFYYWMVYAVTKERIKKRAAVIVSALRGAWCDLCSVMVPTAGRATISQLYTLANDEEKQETISECLEIIQRRRRRAVIVSALRVAWCDLCAVIVPTAGRVCEVIALVCCVVIA